MSKGREFAPDDPSAMRITFLNQKGGVGKSTASILLGGVLSTAGYAVAFDDRDEQGSLTWWAREIGRLPIVGDQVMSDVIICDTPGRLDLSSATNRQVLQPIVAASDRVVIVSEKSAFSLHATKPAIAFARAHIKPGAKILLLFNKVRANTKVGRQNVRDLPEFDGVAVLDSFLALAAPYENVQTEGMSAVTGHYREQVLKLALEILK